MENKYTSEIKNNRKFVIWNDELPFTYKSDHFISSKHDKNIHLSDKHGTVKLAVEIKNGIAVHNNYALIGGEFQYNRGNCFNVKLGVNQHSGENFSTDMTFAGEKAVKGLWSEFAVAIADFDYGDISLPSGNLLLDCAAYTEIGSSINCFKIAYRILIWLLARSDTDICRCEDEIFGLFYT